MKAGYGLRSKAQTDQAGPSSPDVMEPRNYLKNDNLVVEHKQKLTSKVSASPK
jgi:hypothetical protein